MRMLSADDESLMGGVSRRKRPDSWAAIFVHTQALVVKRRQKGVPCDEKQQAKLAGGRIAVSWDEERLDPKVRRAYYDLGRCWWIIHSRADGSLPPDVESLAQQVAFAASALGVPVPNAMRQLRKHGKIQPISLRRSISPHPVLTWRGLLDEVGQLACQPVSPRPVLTLQELLDEAGKWAAHQLG